MIAIKRTAKPKIIEKNEKKWLADLAIARTDDERRMRAGRYKHKEIRISLEKMCHEKCAYCESHISHVAYGHIEHYRPWSKYPKQTFKWTNLLLSCPVCNGKQHKSDQFPTKKFGGPLIDPCKDVPVAHFDFSLDKKNQHAIVIPKTQRGKTTEKILGLNRPELVRRRTNYLRMLIALKTFEQTDLEAAKILKDATSEDGEYLAFCRSLKL